MSRPACRRSPRLEHLESREVLTAGGPSALQQQTLELVNMARTNPAAMADWVASHLTSSEQETLNYYGVNLQAKLNSIRSATPQPPLAWNNLLAQAAQGHSEDMVQNNFQGHTGSDGSSPDQRVKATGYSQAVPSKENAYAYASSVNDAMEAFMLDWGVSSDGHFNNLMQPGVSPDQANREVGIGIVQTGKTGAGAIVMTQDFDSPTNAKPELLGVAYNDDGSHAYEPGEGRGDVTITAVNKQTGASTSVQTWDQGGYQMALDPGKYNVTASVNGKVIDSRTVTIGNDNVEVDYNVTELMQSPNTIQSPVPNPTQNPGAGSNQIVIAPQFLVQQKDLNQNQLLGSTSTVSNLQAVSQSLGLSVSPFSH
ncbi:MAG: hypothetical protein JO116_25295 [Planctomycetaceae bacterium]|nr:hypothetical protein [Planctomycetaceae bacterium]